MHVGESVRTSLEEVKGHPLRSFFTLIGVILGTTALVIVLSVLDGVDAVGQQLNVGGRRLTVSGVGTKFNMEFVNDDDMRKETGGIYIPFSIYRDMYGRNSMSYMLAKAAEPEKSVDAEDEATVVMQKAHNGIRDVHIDNIGKEILKERGKVVVLLRNWRIVFFSIAGISLLIGGVGIFSVLKISISERLFEIGLRKSIGAGDGEIFMQFLIEAVTLSVVGAAIGCAAGIAGVKG